MLKLGEAKILQSGRGTIPLTAEVNERSHYDN